MTLPETTHELEVGAYRVSVPTSFGPRVVSIRRQDGDDLFARLDDSAAIHTPGLPIYRFHGGHRLWAAPEVPEVTYAPDDHPCTIDADDRVITITAPADRAGLVKEIRLTGVEDRLVVDHRIVNEGGRPLALAAWALTQFRLGGVALVPLRSVTPDGLQADRSVVLWPYTDPTDARIAWTSDVVVVAAEAGRKVKLGVGPRPSRLGYFLDGRLFVKEIPDQGPGPYPDRGAVGQVFVEEAFCELESVGPLTALAPGESVSHRETWAIVPCADLATAQRLVCEGVPR